MLLCVCVHVCELSRNKLLLLPYIWHMMADLFLWSVFKRKVCLHMHLSKKHLLNTYYIQSAFRYMGNTDAPSSQGGGSIQMN